MSWNNGYLIVEGFHECGIVGDVVEHYQKPENHLDSIIVSIDIQTKDFFFNEDANVKYPYACFFSAFYKGKSKEPELLVEAFPDPVGLVGYDSSVGLEQKSLAELLREHVRVGEDALVCVLTNDYLPEDSKEYVETVMRYRVAKRIQGLLSGLDLEKVKVEWVTSVSGSEICRTVEDDWGSAKAEQAIEKGLAAGAEKTDYEIDF